MGPPAQRSTGGKRAQIETGPTDSLRLVCSARAALLLLLLVLLLLLLLRPLLRSTARPLSSAVPLCTGHQIELTLNRAILVALGALFPRCFLVFIADSPRWTVRGQLAPLGQMGDNGKCGNANGPCAETAPVWGPSEWPKSNWLQSDWPQMIAGG